MPINEVVKPGDGVVVEKVRLGPIKDALQKGEISPTSFARRLVQGALTSGDTTQDYARTLWEGNDNKVFRNAYASIITEQGWPAYSSLVAGPDKALYGVTHLETGRTRLDQLPRTH